MPRM